MSSRQYGIQPGNSAYHGQRMSEEQSYYDTDPVQLQDYHPPSLQPGLRSPPRRPVAPYERRSDAQPAHYSANQQSPERYRQSTTSPDQDAYGRAAAGGGLTGMAAGIADARPRQSGYEDFRDDHGAFGQDAMPPPPPQHDVPPRYAGRPVAGMHHPSHSQSSVAGLTSHAAPAAMSGGFYDRGMGGGRSTYHGDGYDEFDPRDIADDGDDGVEEYRAQRQSRFGRSAAAGAGVGGTAAGVFGARDASGNYGPLPGGQSGAGRGGEKSEWLQKQSGGNKKLKWIVGSIVVFLILAGVGGAVAGVLLTRGSGGGGGGGGGSAPSMDDIDGLLDIHSPQVQDVLGNKNLHKVFPGMDYSPLKTQYPDCLSDPPDQNNVTLDVAVLSQLTPAVRLYGTDCNQTEMVLEAITRLDLADSLHVWLGVYLDGNQTTNDRQLRQMWDILSNYPASHFAGVIVGNEVLFSQYMSLSELGDYVSTFRANLSAQGIDLPVATADLGDAWTAGLARDSDIVMANVHPFFAGVTPEEAPGWTWDFWTSKDVPLAVGSGAAYPASIIAETGWPSAGGNSDGSGKKPASPTAGAVASVANLNAFMAGWVCEALGNGTTYFWFEAFDEPWKVRFDDPTTGDFWESHWGLLDVNRELKEGVRIPDCGGREVGKPYPQFGG